VTQQQNHVVQPGCVAQIELPPKLIPVFVGKARYRGAYGGRGSGKTRSFAKMAALKAYELSMRGETGLIVIGREYQNTLVNSSLAEIKAAIDCESWLARHFDLTDRGIKTKDGRIAFAFVGLRHNLNSIKSKAKIHLLWVDEAETISEAAWAKAIPTVREEGSEIWVTWNPERKTSATHQRFRVNPPAGAKIVQLNWRDNPWFPAVLAAQRREDRDRRPDHYAHIWEGDFVSAIDGAYFAKSLSQAREEGRVGHLSRDLLLPIRAFWDIGGTGARADSTAIWIAQFVAHEIRVLHYYEAQGQPLAVHVDWLRAQGYEQALMVLPHDGRTHDRVHNASFENALWAAGFDVTIIPNQGIGAARARIEAARRLFPQIWFDEDKTAAGLEALQNYHEKRDVNRNIGLGPAHDWASHGADAFGLMCVAYEAPQCGATAKTGGRYRGRHEISTSWMAV